MGFANDKFGNPIWIPDDGFFEGSVADVSDEAAMMALAGPEMQVNVEPRPDYSQQAIDAVAQIGQTIPLPGAPAPAASGAPPDLTQPSNALIPPGASGPPSDLPIPGGAGQAPTAMGPGGTGTDQSIPPQASDPGQAPIIFPSAPGALKYGDTIGAQKQQQGAFNDSVALAAQAAEAGQAAEIDRMNRVAGVQDNYANKLNEENVAFQTARQAIRKEAEAETARWMQDLDKKAKEEPDPSRWFENKSGFGKVMWLLSLSFGAKAAATAPGVQNIGLQMIQQELQADVASQKARLQREYETMQKRGGQIDAKFAQRYADAQDDHKMMAERWQVVMQSALTRANGPGDADLRKKYADSAAHAGQQVLTMAAKAVDTAMSQKEHDLTRRQQSYLAKMDDTRARDLARIEMDFKKQQANKGTGPDPLKTGDFPVIPVGPSGMRVTGADGKQIGEGVRVSKENHSKLIEMNTASQDKYDALKRVHQKFQEGKKKGMTLDIMLKRDPTLTADIKKLGYGGAKTNDPRGIVTDKDLVNGMESELGADLGSFTGRAKVALGVVPTAKIYELLDTSLKNYKSQMDKKFGQYLDLDLPEYKGTGAQMDWVPTDAEAPTEMTPGAHRSLTEAGLNPATMKIDSRETLAEAEKVEKISPGAMPPYQGNNGQLVQDNIKLMERSGPSAAKAIAAQTIDAVRNDDRAYYETVRAADKAIAKANKAVEALTKTPKSPSQIAKEALEKYSMDLTGEELQAISDLSKEKAKVQKATR